MTSLALLGLIGVVEAAVYQGRYRATHGSPLAAGLWTLPVCMLRVAWVALTVAAVIKDDWVLAMVVYAVPAAVMTAAVRAGEIRRNRRWVAEMGRAEGAQA